MLPLTPFAGFRLAVLAGAALVLPLSAVSPVQAAVVISSAATKNMSCSSGLCAPTRKNAVLNIGDLTSMLASGNVEVSTGSGLLAQAAQDIQVAAGFNWSSANSLTLDAYQSITFQSGAVLVNGTGAVALVTSDGGSNGELSFQPGASLSFASTANSLTINGFAFTLENSVSSLASAVAANPVGDFALANSYDASQDGIYSGSPITTELQGAMEGLGNTISNLSVNVDSRPGVWAGLFSEINTTATVADMVLTQLNYTSAWGHAASIGGLVGLNHGLLFNDYTGGSIAVGEDYAGGLVGENDGVISSSHSSVSVRAHGGTAGGLVAYNSGNDGGATELSSADGPVQGAIAGGIAGDNEGGISECFATGCVRSSGDETTVGGLTGVNGGGVENSYATGSVRGDLRSVVGGLIGQGSGDYQNYSYSTGVVSGGDKGQSLVGGFVGQLSSGLTEDSYWDTKTSRTGQGVGQGGSDGITGLTSEQLKANLPSGFDSAIWAQKASVNHGFPYLINNPPPKE